MAPPSGDHSAPFWCYDCVGVLQEHLSEVDKLHRMLGKGKTVSKTLRDRDNELQEIQRNMTTWKASTVEKLAKKFQEEMARELEK